MKLRFRKKEKTGRHIVRIDGVRRSIAPGDTVVCEKKDLGTNIEYLYTCLSPMADQVEEVVEAKHKAFEIVKVEGKRLYNIVNPDNVSKPLNDKPLSRAAAIKLLATLEGHSA